ncbi:ROK family protein [Novosphingobium umbonatum]|uniref:fructokinase n=1 Tax=Novosphingobium umbonatum TaxID=1908524 RepID=A0A3S3TT28_9SPHN|nr:ROK family protein [Novosphingobium umbonatum]RVU07873.1 ROK family protein [Novosphingobium umbonatum]
MAQYGLIEAGGTKFVLGVADEAGTISARHQIPTTTPAETLGATVAWFKAQALQPEAIGIASFGPLDLNRASPTWGHVTKTPKPHWSGADLAGPLAKAFGCPIGLETDVNGAALAEARWGVGRGLGSLLYLTVGTGVGGGFVSDGRLLQGLSHPEMGHIRLPRHPDDEGFPGHCPFHGACLEGLAAGPSIIARWGASLSDLPADHKGAEIIAWYLGQAVVTFQAIMEPARIVLGGGVMNTPGMIDRVRAVATQSGGGYFVGDPREVVVSPGLGQNSGLLGALAVALAL